MRVRSASLEEALGRVWHASQRDGDVRISLEEALAHVWQVHVILSSHPSLVPNTDVSDDRPRMICFYASTPWSDRTPLDRFERVTQAGLSDTLASLPSSGAFPAPFPCEPPVDRSGTSPVTECRLSRPHGRFVRCERKCACACGRLRGEQMSVLRFHRPIATALCECRCYSAGKMCILRRPHGLPWFLALALFLARGWQPTSIAPVEAKRSHVLPHNLRPPK